MPSPATALRLSFERQRLPMAQPFRISGYVFNAFDVVVAGLSDGREDGLSEAAGVYYLDDGPEQMVQALEAARATIEDGLSRTEARALLPPGGARNALDAALWELEARRAGMPVWQLAGLPAVRPLITTFTVGADDPEVMAKVAEGYVQARAIKLKLTGDAELDTARVRAVRLARPEVWLGVDANQGYGPDTLPRLISALVDQSVSLLEQPCRRGHEAELDGIDHAIPIAADESVQGLDEIEALAGRFDVVNIKLDKCGGLTEGLLMAARARELGMGVMVGNMGGSSLAMAPAFVLGQHCDIVDLDGPVFLSRDRVAPVRYADGAISCGDEVWGPDRISPA